MHAKLSQNDNIKGLNGKNLKKVKTSNVNGQDAIINAQKKRSMNASKNKSSSNLLNYHVKKSKTIINTQPFDTINKLGSGNTINFKHSKLIKDVNQKFNERPMVLDSSRQQ